MNLTPPLLTVEEPIQVHIAGDKAYVYDVESIRRLRVDHHITGITLGTLPQVSQQNVFLGVPLQLLPEEVAVLIEERLACLIDDKFAHSHANPDEAAEYADARRRAIAAQQNQALAQEEEKTRLMKEKYKDQIEKRQKERQAKKEQRERIAKLQASQEGNESILLPAGEEKNVVQSAKVDNVPAGSSQVHKASSHMPYSIITPTTSDGRSWYHPDPLSTEVDPLQSQLSFFPTDQQTRSNFFLLDAANHFSTSTITPERAALNNITKRGHGLMSNGLNWNDGSGLTNSSSSTGAGDETMVKLKEARVHVYKDLWKKGYFMGSGLKFGADFLVYPGDPLRFHSHFVCTVLSSPLTDIPPLDIVAWGRLATAVKKSHLIASWDEKKAKVEYLSLEWAGFG